jgi:hypothetical protein
MMCFVYVGSPPNLSVTVLTSEKTVSSFSMFANSIEAVYLVEASPHLQKQQAKLLAGTEDLHKSDLGWTAPLKYIAGVSIQWCEDIRFVPKGTGHWNASLRLHC